MRRPVQHIFLFIGAEPNTDWLSGSGVELDPKGYVLTGTGKRRPLETSREGVAVWGNAASGPTFWADAVSGSTNTPAAPAGDLQFVQHRVISKVCSTPATRVAAPLESTPVKVRYRSTLVSAADARGASDPNGASSRESTSCDLDLPQM